MKWTRRKLCKLNRNYNGKPYSFGFYGEGPNYSTLPPADFETKFCKCGEKAIYRAAGRAFCKAHREAAVYWTKKEFGRYFGRITAELRQLGEI